MHALYLCVVMLLEIVGDVSQSAGAFVCVFNVNSIALILNASRCLND